MALEEEDDGGGIPEWVVTFGDMMSLLLTFFIMLVSLSEIKQEQKFQALVESLQRQFGHKTSRASIVPGHSKPRNAELAKLATMGRARRFDTHKGGDKTAAPVGDHPRVMIVRPGSKTSIGTLITFPEGVASLSDANKRDLRRMVVEVGGKPQKIEIRGHTSQKPLDPNNAFKDHWQLAYQRCRNTMAYLVDLGIDPVRLRMSVAGPNEPYHIGTDPVQLRKNPRVEVYMLDEIVEDLAGTDKEKNLRFLDAPREADAP